MTGETTHTVTLTDAQVSAEVHRIADEAFAITDALLPIAKEYHANPEKFNALVQDIQKLSQTYGIAEETSDLMKIFITAAGNPMEYSSQQKKLQSALESLAEKITAESHPLHGVVTDFNRDAVEAFHKKDAAFVDETLNKLLGEHGLPDGELKTLIGKLRSPLTRAAKLAPTMDLLKDEISDERMPVLLKELFTNHHQKIQSYITEAQTMGVQIPAEALEGLETLKREAGVHGTAERAPDAGEAAATSKTTVHSNPGSSAYQSTSPASSISASSAESEGKGILSFLGEHAGWKAAGIGAAAIGGGLFIKHVLDRRSQEQAPAEASR